MESKVSSTPYLLLFRNSGPETHQHLTPGARQNLIIAWNEWYDRLRSQGKAVDGRPLQLETRVVSGAGGARVIDGPFAEAKEAIGGYVVVMATDKDEATRFAQQHPGLAYGLIIEVREMAPHCHLGIGPGRSTPAALAVG